MATNACNVNQLESDWLLPPRKRLLAGYKKQNSIIVNGRSPSFASSSSTTTTTTSNGGYSDVETHLENVFTSQLNDKSLSPEELAHFSKANADLAVKAAKAARAKANEKAMIASKAVAAAKNALEMLASFPDEAVGSPRKKHVQLLHSKIVAYEDLLRRLNLVINNSPRVLKDCSAGHINKKQKSSVTSTMYDGLDAAGVLDSDSSVDEEVDRTRVNGKLLLCDNALKEKTEEESSSLWEKRVRLKIIKKLPLSVCVSKDQENGTTKSPIEENNVGLSKPLAQVEGSDDGGVAQVIVSGPKVTGMCEEAEPKGCSLIVSGT